jgi:DNA-binding NtrC family response regulator
LHQVLANQRTPVDVILLDLDFQLPWADLLPSGKPLRPRKDELARLRRYQGIEILKELRKHHGSVPVVLMTAHDELAFETDADALAAEEYTYFAGDGATDARALKLLIERIAARRSVVDAGLDDFFWGSSTAMAQLRQRADIVARSDRPLLLLGEPGTGKSRFAETVIHPGSQRQGPFCSLDLSTLPESLVASELFGCERGAFSGAADRPGRFEHANGGTLLLDEIGHVPPPVQRALLAVLQDRRVTRLGANEARPVDVRVVAATNEDLEKQVARKAFRPDLLMRLNPAARLVMPPLRERRSDIPALVQYFVRRCFSRGGHRDMLLEYGRACRLGSLDASHISVAFGQPSPTLRQGVCFTWSRKTSALLTRAPWPGNLRQLELLVEAAVTAALTDAFRAQPATGGESRLIPVGAKVVRELLQTGNAMLGRGDTSGPAQGGETFQVHLEPGSSLREVSRSVERQYLERLFQATEGDFRAMAGKLLGRTTAAAARQVRLRFNQVGLRVTELKER